MKIKNYLHLVIILSFVACSDTNNLEHFTDALKDDLFKGSQLQSRPQANPDKNAYFGDLHVHTANSLDAYTFGTITSPADAYRYAQGGAILHPSGYQIQLSRPLDFYAVTDHAYFLGLLNEAADTNSKFSHYEVSKPLHNLNNPAGTGFLSLLKRANLFRPLARSIVDGIENGEIDGSLVSDIGRSVWQETIKAADYAYKPGIFTTFAGYEYTSGTGIYNNYLHRNVIFRETKNLPPTLFSRADPDPEKLWDWMDRLRANGIESLAIPHNTNLSGGVAFSLNDYNGGPIDQEYVKKRSLNEPLVEITQTKGTSETHPFLSKNDEWASFETKSGVKDEDLLSNIKGSYVRDAYLRGLTLEEKGIGNPFKFGLIGSSDTHVSGSSESEELFFSKAGLLDGKPDLRGSIPFNRFYGTFLKIARPEMFKEVDGKNYFAASSRLIHFSSSGLAGVWAEENTREAIYDALRRKETFATSGPRIKIRFFAGYNIDNLSLDDLSLIQNAYAGSIPMGGTLNIQGNNNPTFLIWAISDPLGVPLQRIQIIKGWLEDGEHKEKVFDVACSDGLSIDSENYRCPDNEAWVNLDDCSTSIDSGARELKVFWQDPEFKNNQEAFYYSRVLENPVCRWSTWDAIRSGEKPRSDIPATIQERAWSSPIWLKKTS